MCIVSTIAVASYAQKGDETKPIQIEADHGTVDQKQMTSIFEGRVVITRGSLIVHADKATASQDPSGEKVLTLIGKPVTFSQLTDDGGKIEGQGNEFTYDTKSGLGVLSGRARIKKGQSIVIGDKVTYNSKTQVYSASSTISNGVSKKATSGRITVILDQNESVGSVK